MGKSAARQRSRSQKKMLKFTLFESNDHYTTCRKVRLPEAWFDKHTKPYSGSDGMESPECGLKKEHHLAAPEGTTHFQQILEGHFTVMIGPKDAPQEVVLKKGMRAAFRDSTGIGHASLVSMEDLTDGEKIGCFRIHRISTVRNIPFEPTK